MIVYRENRDNDVGAGEALRGGDGGDEPAPLVLGPLPGGHVLVRAAQEQGLQRVRQLRREREREGARERGVS
jgi:hypothetical protein